MKKLFFPNDYSLYFFGTPSTTLGHCHFYITFSFSLRINIGVKRRDSGSIKLMDIDGCLSKENLFRQSVLIMNATLY